MIGPPGRTQLGEQLNKILLSIAAIASLALTGCSGAGEAAPTSSAVMGTAAAPVVDTPTMPGEAALAAAGNPTDCEEDIFGTYAYRAYCPDSELLLLEVEPPEEGGKSGADFATKNDWTGWWAAADNWLILGTKEETAKIAAANYAQHFHTPGMSSLIVDGLPYQWEDFANEKPQEQVHRLAEELEDATRASCNNHNFNFQHGAVAGGKCTKAIGIGASTIGIYKNEKELKKAMKFFTKTIGLLDAPYITLVGETWLIMNVEESSADALQEKVGGKIVQLSS